MSNVLDPYDSASSTRGTTQGSIDLRDPLVKKEIILIGVIYVVGDHGRRWGRGNIPISEGYLNIPAPM